MTEAPHRGRKTERAGDGEGRKGERAVITDRVEGVTEQRGRKRTDDTRLTKVMGFEYTTLALGFHGHTPPLRKPPLIRYSYLGRIHRGLTPKSLEGVEGSTLLCRSSAVGRYMVLRSGEVRG